MDIRAKIEEYRRDLRERNVDLLVRVVCLCISHPSSAARLLWLEGSNRRQIEQHKQFQTQANRDQNQD
jgi:hypothetical protein